MIVCLKPVPTIHYSLCSVKTDLNQTGLMEDMFHKTLNKIKV